ncbi:STY1053 family phage-associated protein [Serratia inhibens]|uniref:STY1053 family phage-associated protein n=1 Tax=Serratia inhibens TaxID=2338073 RepID=UPI0032178ED0
MTKEKLVSIHVHTPFKLTHADNSVQEFGKGRHNVPEAVATHWFVEAHTEALGDYTPPNIDEAGAQRITELEAKVTELQRLLELEQDKVAEQAEQLQAAAAGLIERNDQITELNAQVADLSAKLEKINGAAKK